MDENNNVQFQGDDVNEYGRPAAAGTGSAMADWLIRRGWAKDAQQAQYILIGVIVACLLIAGYFIFGGAGSSTPALPPSALGLSGALPGGTPGASPQ